MRWVVRDRLRSGRIRDRYGGSPSHCVQTRIVGIGQPSWMDARTVVPVEKPGTVRAGPQCRRSDKGSAGQHCRGETLLWYQRRPPEPDQVSSLIEKVEQQSRVLPGVDLPLRT